MTRWDTPGIPHKGWECETVYDVREDGSDPEEAEYEVCQMCGNERIRYVHVMSHPNYAEDLHVGCVCAEKMSDDYIGPRQRESGLKNRAARRGKWLTRKWRISGNGNSFLNVDGYNIVIFPDKYREGFYGFKIGEEFSKRKYKSEPLAKLAAFDRLWELIQ